MAGLNVKYLQTHKLIYRCDLRNTIDVWLYINVNYHNIHGLT